MASSAIDGTTGCPDTKPVAAGSAREVFVAFLRLGCISFGGPIAHLGYFHSEFVERRAWCGEEAFAEIVALAQSLPGPGSSQTGFALGLLRAGWKGGLAAWAGFTLPSALLMLAFALCHPYIAGKAGLGAVHGLQLVAVAVVAQALLSMRRSLAPDVPLVALAMVAAGIVFFTGQTLAAIASGALLVWLLPPTPPLSQQTMSFALLSRGLSHRVAVAAGIVFFALLALLPVAETLSASWPATSSAHRSFAVANAFYRSGALVFGGGHVVLPLLEHAVVSRGWVDQASFLSGYGAAQAIPGPLFTFAAFLGASIHPSPSQLAFSGLALVALFLPGLLLIVALLPFWEDLRRRHAVRTGLRGINAAVVGVLLAAFARPVCSSAIHSPLDLAVAIGATVLLLRYKLPPWLLVVLVVSFSALAWLF